MFIVLIYCFCVLTAFLAIFNGMIGNLVFVLMLISVGSCLRIVIEHYKMQSNHILNIASHAFFIVPAVAGPAADIEDNLLFFIFGVCGIWALIILHTSLLIKLLERVLSLKNK